MQSLQLTGRQKQFLYEMSRLEEENAGHAIHYSLLAERLGVSHSTAYTMLRILERKGCVIARFHLPSSRVRRIGRSTVLFEMTHAGHQLIRQLA